MSLQCLLGMHDIIWHYSGSSSFRLRNHVRSLDKCRMNPSRLSNSSSRPNIDGLRRAVRSKNNSSNNLDYLLPPNKSESFPSQTSPDTFHSGNWRVSDSSQQEEEEGGDIDSEFSGDIASKKVEVTRIQKIMPSTKKIWSSDSRMEKESEKQMYFQQQWQETPWAISSETDKSEHAVSQPIMMKQRGNQLSFGNQEQQSSVVSPRSADGLGVYGMVEYVLASSPGGGDLEATMKGMNINGALGGDAPEKSDATFDESVENQALHIENDSSKSETPIQDDEPQLSFSRTPGSRQESPNPNSQHQDGMKSNGYVQDGQSKGKHESSSESIVTSPVQFITHIDASAIGIETLPFSYSESQMQAGNHEGMARNVAQQQQPMIIGNAQQQQYGVALASSPYFVTNTGQDPYANGSISILNANGQPAVIPTQYAAAATAYGVQPWAYPSAGGNAAFVQQQQPQQLQQSQVRTQAAAPNRGTSGEQIIGQQLGATPSGFQVIQGPVSIPAGATFYDQQGNPVIINGRMTQQLTNQLGQPIRMVSSMVINNSGQTAVSPQMQGQAPQAIQLLSTQQQQQSQQTQQPRQQQGSSINLGYLSTGNVGPLNAVDGVSNMSIQNGGPVGVIGGHLSTSLPSTAAQTIGGVQARRDPFGPVETIKQQNLTQLYPGVVGSYNALTVNTPLANNLNITDTNTSPIHGQNQASFNLGSPISSRFSGYMSLLAGQTDRKFNSNSSSLVGGSIFAPSATSIYRKSGRDSGRSKLLEDFRNNRYPTLQLRDLTNHIVEFSQDQHGSRFIQQKLERASVVEKNLVFTEISLAAYSLMTDVFGNYVIQKFFEFGSPDQKMSLANRIKGHVLQLALQMYGCRVIQKALESIPEAVQKELVAELDGHVLKCVKDQNGNHVVQKCIECVDAAHLQFIIDAFRGQVFALSTHPYGCRVIQRILEHCSPEQTSPILAELHDNTDRLVQDQYGNYVIQHVLEHGSPDDKIAIISLVRGNVLLLSQHKFASNVVEKCVTHATRADRAALIDEVCNDASPGALYTMMKDQFANYVVQKMIDVAEPLQKKMLVHKIRPHVATLRKFTYGKHILAKLEKLEKAFYMKPNMDMVFLPPSGQVL